MAHRLMSARSTRSTSAGPLRRRSLLRLLLASGLGLGAGRGLTACGGGADDSGGTDADPATAVLQGQADAAVADGLVGLSLGLLRHTADAPSAHAVTAGVRRLGQSAAVQGSDRFAIGSNTKAMTCAAILAVADRGGPALSMTAAQAWADQDVEIHPAYASVTLTDLLHHRAGLPPFNGSGPEEDRFIAAVDAATGPRPDTPVAHRAWFTRWLLAQAPADGVVPGRDVVYSNAGYVLAAALVEAHTGRSFEVLFDEALVQPLALQGAWRSPVPNADDLLWGHEGEATARAVVEPTPESIAVQDWLDVLGPAGHWACTGEAYAHWLRWHLLALRGAATPLPAAYVRDLRAASGDRHVWGWQTLATPQRLLLTHTGHEPGFMAEAVVDRSGDFAIFGLTNTGHMNAEGGSWVLGRLDRALSEVLKRSSIAL